MFLGASEYRPIGQLELEQLLPAFQVGHVGQHRTVERLHPRTDVVLAEVLDGGLFTGKGVEHPGVASYA